MRLCPTRPLTILKCVAYIVSCVFRQADIGPPIIGYSVVREKSLFIGPSSGASVRLALETFLTCLTVLLGNLCICIQSSRMMEDTGVRVLGISDVHDV